MPSDAPAEELPLRASWGGARQRLTARVLAGTAVAVALAVLVLGWLLGLDAVVRIRPAFAAMVPSTAVCFALLGTGLLLRVSDPRRQSRTALAMSVLVGAVAALDLAIFWTVSRNGIDGVLFPGRMGRDYMAFATAASFLLGAYCLAGLSAPRLYHARAVEVCATLGLMAALVAIVGYAYDSEALYGVFLFSAMALHTAVTFALLFAAILLASWRDNWTGVLFDEGSGSAGARRLFPLAIAGPFLLCLLSLRLTAGGAFDANFRISLLAIAMMTLAAAAVLRNAVIENRAERRLLGTMEDLARSNADKELLLREVYHRVKNNLQQVTAMLRIEARQRDDPALRASYDATAERIRALGLVHQLLISSSAPSEVRARDFLRELVDNIAAGNDLARRGMEIEVEADEDRLQLDVAVSLGRAGQRAGGERDQARLRARFRRAHPCRLCQAGRQHRADGLGQRDAAARGRGRRAGGRKAVARRHGHHHRAQPGGATARARWT